MNKAILLGRLTKKPEIRFSQATNNKIAIFTLAVNRNYVKEGEERQADFINIVAYSKLADFAEKYLSQGIQICLGGRIQTRTWQDNNGTKRYTTEIIAEEINFADAPKRTDNNIDSINNSQNNTMASFEESISDSDDLPF